MRAIGIFISLFCFTSPALSQDIEQTSSNEKIRIKSISHSMKNALTYLRLDIELILVKKINSVDLSICNTEIESFPSDSIVINLKNDLSWDLNGDPPKLPSFYLFKRNDPQVINGLKFLKFQSEFEKNGIPYHMIRDFYTYKTILNKEGDKCLELNYKIQTDSLGNMNIATL